MSVDLSILYDLVIEKGRVLDPVSGLDRIANLVVNKGRIVAITESCEVRARARIVAAGLLVVPGLIDLHTHVYEWVTNFGVRADAAGVEIGITTLVDQGSSGAWTFGGFKTHVIDTALTDVRAFVSVNAAGALMGGMKGDILHNPSLIDADGLVALIAQYPHLIKGIKCHAESGALSHWGTQVLEAAVQIANRADVPLYAHTGELFPVVEENRPPVDSVMTKVLPLFRAGDVLAHIYSSKPDGIVGASESVPQIVHRALQQGLHFDIGYGINFSYRIARMLMAEGIMPYTISSDVHGDFNAFHDDSKLDYSLLGAMTRLHALGMPLMEVIRATTLHPARILREEAEIGTLAVGSRADITLLEMREGDHPMRDGQGETVIVQRRLIPALTVRAGRPITPALNYARDIVA